MATNESTVYAKTRQGFLPLTQRWRLRRDTYVPLGDTVDTREVEVAATRSDKEIKAFVRAHYLGSCGLIRRRFFVYWRGMRVGALVYAHPTHDGAITSVLPGEALESLELNRMFFLDVAPNGERVPSNIESHAISVAHRVLAREGFLGAITFSDPVKRPDPSEPGRYFFLGHAGTAFAASGARYLGRSSPEMLRIFKTTGHTLAPRTLAKARKGPGEKGYEGAIALLARYGADRVAPSDRAEREEWLRVWLEKLTFPLRHTGNFKFLFVLDKRIRRHVPEGLPYPKLIVSPDEIDRARAARLAALEGPLAPRLPAPESR